MREHDDCMTYETVAKEADGGDSKSVSEQFQVTDVIKGKKINIFLTVCFDFKNIFIAQINLSFN